MKKILFIVLLVILIVVVYKENNDTYIIPDNAIRLRVIPNSNNYEDIIIKEKVKKYLEKDIYDLTSNTKSIDEARAIINQNVSIIEKNIDNIFVNNNYKSTYHVNYGYNYFPEKSYKGIKYNEGYYESLVIEIGNAEGDNWWCVLFPNMCLIDKNNKPEYKSFIKEIITKYSKK